MHWPQQVGEGLGCWSVMPEDTLEVWIRYVRGRTFPIQYFNLAIFSTV